MQLETLGLQIDSPLAHIGAINFRPPNWPPPPDWPPIVNAHGIPQCIYSDSSWPLDVWSKKPLKINFGDGRTMGRRIDTANANLLRQCATWFIWGPRGARSASSFCSKFSVIKPIFATCADEGIVATDLMRFPAVLEKVSASLSPSNFSYAISILHDLLDAKEDLGFCLLDIDGLAKLAMLAPRHDAQQTPYIPPRIWSYQLSRLRECLEDYTKYRTQIEACYKFCLDAYICNYGSLQQAFSSTKTGYKGPFINSRPGSSFTHHGSFKFTADRFGLTDLLERWVEPFTGEKGENQIAIFSRYLDLASKVGLGYLLNFSLMRVEEGWDLRSDCLLVEKDERFGDIHMLRGETTKTDPDADARWPTSKSTSLAIDVMSHIAAMRLQCAKERSGIDMRPEEEINPYLISYNYEPWSQSKTKIKSYRIRPTSLTYMQILEKFPKLLDSSQITINEEDLRIARLMTPSLDPELYKIGVPWRFGWHQLRRTGAVNMLSSEMVDESSLQVLLKHQARVMTLYYGRNHSRLNLSEDTRKMFLKTMYEEIGRDLRSLPTAQFVSPLGTDRKEKIVTFIRENDAVSLNKAAMQGKIRARRIRAGFCVNHTPCPYGGVEAIAHCLGGDSNKGCPDLLVDIKKEDGIKLYEKIVDDQLKSVHPESPRHRSLQAEKRAIRNFYAAIQK